MALWPPRGLPSVLLFAFVLVAAVALVPSLWLFLSILAATPAEQASARAQSWILVAIAASPGLLVAILLGLGLANRLVHSLAALRTAAEGVAEGSFDAALLPASSFEIAEAARSFARTAAIVQQTYASLAEERDRLGAVLRNMADGIIIVNADRVVDLVNPAAQRALALRDVPLVGQRLAAVVQEYEIIELARRCLTVGQPGQDFTSSLERASPRRYLRLVATRLGEGREAKALLVLQDLTEMRRLETVRRDFLANVSHELRTPLAALKVMVETLEDGALDDPEAARDFLGRMHSETDGLAQLVEELLQLSRIESGQADIHLESVPVGELVSHAARRLTPLAERAGLRLQVDPTVPEAYVLADRERVGQVLVNLVHNAIKFTPPGGSVSLAADISASTVTISVADTGVGIAPDDLPRIFERFYKADRARASGGTGLGLAIAKHLVRAHGGSIWAESAGPGRGSRFAFTLPVARGRASTPK
ncbi:MAG: sensor histidine kinase [Chloroflexota bacterium]